MIYLGNNEIKKIYLGETSISSGFVGELQFYPKAGGYGYKAKLTLINGTEVEIPATGTSDTVLTPSDISAYQNDIAQVEVYNGVTEIGGHTFNDCNSLTSTTLPNTLTTIGEYAFNGTPLQSIVIPNSVTSIGERAFEYCAGLTSVTLSNSITAITNSCFSECSSLESFDIPASVVTIEQYAFHNNALTSITIPSAVTTIGTAAFKGGQSLQTIEVEGINPPALLRDSFDDWGYAFDDTNNAPIYVPCDSVAVYKSAEGWSDYEDRISCQRNIINPNFDVYYQKEEGDENDWQIFNPALINLIDKIGVYNDNGECEEYDIPADGKLPYATLTDADAHRMGFILKTPTALDTSLFDSTDFREIDGILTTAPWTRIYNSVEGSLSMGEEKLINLPDTVQRVEDWACAGLSVSLPDGQGGFEMSRLPSACTYIGDYAFESARLTNDDSIPFEIPARITHIGEFAFEGASLPKTINFNATIGVPDEFMFQVPFYISNVNIAEGNTSIGAGAFHSDAIKDFSLPSTLRTIGDNAFYGVGLTDGESDGSGITIPAGVTSIGDYAFQNTFIPAIYFNGATPPTIGTDVFTNCNAEPDVPTPIYVPCASVNAYKAAWTAWADRISCIPSPEPDPSTEYFHFEALTNGSVVKLPSKFNYSTDKTTWTQGNNGTMTLNAGDKVYYKDINYSTLGGVFSEMTTGQLKVVGNSMSLYYGDDFKDKKEFPKFANSPFAHLFAGSTNIIDASNLKLPAMTLKEESYVQMFDGCTSLTSAPELPATTLASLCYWLMFRGCTSLTSAPELPATTLADNCYGSMFIGCTSLTTAPTTLPATTLADNCYSNMFSGCTSLQTAPALPATALTLNCYNAMFAGCTSLKTAPALPATALALNCYNAMFAGCTSLKTAPALPATALATNCYSHMFSNCSSLTTAPETLPATTLKDYCYGFMFYGCTSLRTAPVLPALTLVSKCYNNMFGVCRKLNYVKAMFTTTPSTTYTSSWLYWVASSGTFVKNSAATWDVRGANGIPNGWTVQTAEP